MVAPVNEPTQPPERYRAKLDDDDLARGLVSHWEGKLRFFHGNWHDYTGGSWNIIPLPEVNNACREYLRERRQNHDVKITRGLVNSVVSLASDECYIRDEMIDQGDEYINLQNGLYNITTQRMEPHRSDLYLTNQLDFTYDEDADCPHWRKYLNTSLVHPATGKTDHKLILLLQEALAYSLTADTSLKASFWLVGKPDSGKSKLITLIRDMLGNFNATIDLNQLASNKFMLSNIAGKRAVTFTEARVNSVLPDDIFKSLVGGTDEIFADVKFGQGISFVPKAKVWWAMNDMPRIVDRSGAVYNRLYAIPFNRSIPAEDRILNLSELLKAERPGIFNWLLVGLHRLKLAGKFTHVEQSEDVKERARLENDTELSFVKENVDISPDESMAAQELYQSYRGWCESNGFKSKNLNQAAREWERLGFERIVRNGRHFWKGGALKRVILR